MSSVSASQLPGLLTRMSYEVMIPAYENEPTGYQDVFNVLPLDPMAPAEGFTGRALIGATEPTETRRGQPAPHRTLDESWQWFCYVRKFQEMITIPEEIYNHPDALAKITEIIRGEAGGYGSGFASMKDKTAAAIFNRGSITAGDKSAFKGSYTGHADPNEGLIYDGKPLFAASGNGHPFKIASTATALYNQDANALTSTNLNTALQLHVTTNAYNEANEHKGGNRPNMLLVPPALEKDASVILNSTQLAGTAQNDVNYMRGMFNLKSWWALTDTDGWFLGAAKKGMTAWDSGKPTVEVSMPDRETGSVSIRFKSYFAAHNLQWRHWSAHATSTS